MAVSAYEVISTQTLGSDAATVTFSSIPQTYTDLVFIVFPFAVSVSADDIYFKYNNDATALYSQTGLKGNGSAASSARATAQNQVFTSLTGPSLGSTSEPRTTIFNIMNYSNTTTFKTTLVRENVTNSIVTVDVSLYRSTAAITRIDIMKTGTFATGSTFTLYGIKAA